MVPRRIVIEPVLNGYMVKVGCQTVVFDERERMLDELNAYLKDPAGREEHYAAEAIHGEMMTRPVQPELIVNVASMPDPQMVASRVAEEMNRATGHRAEGGHVGGPVEATP